MTNLTAARSRVLSSILALILACAAISSAQVPSTLSYQGRLLENDVAQGPASGTVDIVFSIWSGPTGDAGATQLWTETWNGVALSNGIFSVLLGSNGSPLSPALFQGDTSLFLQLTVDGETLTPRQELGSTPFAMVDDPANELQDLSLSGNTLSLSDDPTNVDLSGYLDNTDAQDLSLSGNTLSLSNDPTSVDLSGYLDNTDQQTLGLSGNTLTISGSGSSVDLASAMQVSDLRAQLTRRVFVSSQAYTGGLGGLGGADGLCQELAENAGLTGRFTAWLSGGGQTAATRLDRLGIFELVDGTRIADDWADLTDGTLQNGINLSENGGSVADGPVWTGTATDGELSSNNCSDWSSSVSGANGDVGQSGSTGSPWTANGSAACNSSARLYCVEQLAAQTRDNQVLSLSGNSLQLTYDNGVYQVDLAPYLDDTDEQDLSLSGNNLNITNGTGVNLSAFKDNTDSQNLSLSGNTLNISGGSGVSLSAFKDNTDSQDINSVLQNGTDANNRDITNLDDVDIDKLTIDDKFTCDADSADCIKSENIEKDTILGNDVTDRIFILHIDCNGSCANMSMRDACDVIENLRNLDFETELIGVSCTHGIPSTTGNQFVTCDSGSETFGAYECRAFELRTLGDLPCINDDGTDVIVTCWETDIPKT
ncbi:MAG: hypothetical protein KDD11_23405 [Acidobacteria bacterium]|nr:hypothetical protein [Acidobacteriota bacterium]